MESNNRKRTIAISSFLLTILALGSIAGIILYRNEPVVLQGRIECERTTISGKIIGRVGNLYVNEGDTVAPGDTLAALTSPELEAELTSASAMEQVAQYQNIKIDAGTRKEVVKMLKEAYDAAFANYTLSATTLERSTRLYKDSVITSQRMDEIKALHKNAEAALNSARLQYEMALEGAQREDKESARAMVNAAAR